MVHGRWFFLRPHLILKLVKVLSYLIQFHSIHHQSILTAENPLLEENHIRKSSLSPLLLQLSATQSTANGMIEWNTSSKSIYFYVSICNKHKFECLKEFYCRHTIHSEKFN